MLNREWGAESKGKLLHLFIPSKTATLVPEFEIEDLPLGRTSALVPEFVVKEHSDGIFHIFLANIQVSFALIPTMC